MKKKYLIFSVVLIFSLLFLFACSQDKMQQTRKNWMKMPVVADGAKKVGSEACADCHDELVTQFKTNIHGRIIPGETAIGETGCETCHGPGSVHIEEEDPDKIINPKKVDAVAASSICLRCHNSDEHQNWDGSEHALNDVSCVECHKVHDNHNEYLLVKEEPELCFTCHRDIQAKTNYPTHHPVKEGKMKCSDCHANHGSMLNNLKTDERLTDLCLNCHQRYQGPFTFEHEPVVEDCSICHEPHGTVAQNLLKQNEPFLCLQCHHIHFHSAVQSASDNRTGVFQLPSSSNTTLEGQQNPHAVQMMMTTKCTTCHSAVHGSDIPSLAIPGGGKALTR